MYRGDDIYLLNWWPLDNLNTVGGGARYDFGSRLTVAAHVGVNRLDDPYQLQSITVAPRFGFGPVNVLLLDRPRAIASLKATYWFAGRTARAGLKLSLYGEYHSMASGVRQVESNDRELLPSDLGYVAGAQLSLYTGVRSTFANLFVRYGQGLGAYGDLRVPVASVATRTAARAQDFVVAAAGNWDLGPFALMAAGYLRYFRDADPGVFSRDALWEGTLVARPIVYFGQHAGLSLEASYQSVVMDTLDPETGSGPWRASVWRFGVVPFITPGGRGSFTRPHLQLIYLLTLRDEGARRLYAPGDPFGTAGVEHFLGVATEWWFNSSYL
jgi:maltoporin